MHAHALLTLQLALLVAIAVTDAKRDKVILYKCCEEYEMLSGDGRECVKADWPRNASIHRNYYRRVIPPLDSEWVGRWLPPGLPMQSVSAVSDYYTFGRQVWTDHIRVNASYAWDTENPFSEDILRTQIVFIGNDYIARPRPGGGLRKAFYCVDAALPPLGPFALLYKTPCSKDECLNKCCRTGELLLNREGNWICETDSQGFWSPIITSFTKDIDPGFPYEAGFRCSSSLRLAAPDSRSALWARTGERHLLFSTWGTCLDYHRNNGALEEGLFYCDYLRVARGIYWLVRPLCIVSAFLLAASLLSIACDRSMRRKMHGWCLATHASCLFCFNIGQVVYYMTISDTIHDSAIKIIPQDLKSVCRIFALWMYFLLTAAWFWLTALCVNMTLGFRLQVAHSSRECRKKFFAFSAFAWGLPALLTISCSVLFVNQLYVTEEEDTKWYTPSLMETRVCFTESIVFKLSGVTESFSLKYGTALFYYGPVGCLVLCNIVCLVITLRKVQYLSRGNSVLRREYDHIAMKHRQMEGNNIPTANTNSEGRKHENRNGGGNGAAVDEKTIKLNIKMLLITSGIELISEFICWATIYYVRSRSYALRDHDLPYRATGYVTDFFRAAVVAWLATPEGGYLGPILRRMRGEERMNSSTRTTNGGRGERNIV